ncbi:MAG TPA: LacI family DNA-binding transcriptional regulator [Tepidisphaeraceae bacterium]|jgi:DNA-binding LacI/PurR family transcriptional regulator
MRGLIGTKNGNGSQATIADVARLSGLSTATVSRVFTRGLDSDPKAPVRDSTRKRVMRVARELGYHPHWFARALAKGQSHAIGLLFEGDTPSLGSVHQKIVSKFTATLHSHGYRLLFIPVGEDDATWQQMLLGGHLEGCICIGSVHPAVREALCGSDLPAVVLNADTECSRPRVTVDDCGGARQLTEYLINLGHRRIIFFYGLTSDPNHYSLADRQQGFSEAIEAAGLSSTSSVWHCPVDRLMQEHFDTGGDSATAVVAYSQYEAIPLLHRLWESGRRVPEDISVVTFNNMFPVEYTTPPLTTMSVVPVRIGWVGAALLLRQLRDRQHMGSRVVRLKEEMIVRRSAGPAPKH